MTLPRVVVLGCGPAGLMAAAAADLKRHPVTILSRKRKSPLWGCQYLHGHIPGYTPEGRVNVWYGLQGTVEGYRQKVYGEEYDGTVSPEELGGDHWAWDLRRTYDNLWAVFEQYTADVPILDGHHAAAFLEDFLKAGDIVISTIPRIVMCANRKHVFDSRQIWAMGDSDEQRVPVRPDGENTVMCNGDPGVGWYRASSVFGYATVEWPWRNGRRPPFEGVALVDKPIMTDCTCLPDVHYVGRYGKWEKGVLVHQVYDEVQALLTNVQERLF